METTKTSEISDMQLHVTNVLKAQENLANVIADTIKYFEEIVEKNRNCDNCGKCFSCEVENKIKTLKVNNSWLKRSFLTYADFEELNDLISGISEIIYLGGFSRRERETFQKYILPVLEKEFDNCYVAYFNCN